MLRRAAALTVLALAPLTVACSSNGDDARPSGSSGSTVTSAADATTTSATIATTIPILLQPQPDPASAAGALIDAWKAGDQAGAATLGPPEAVQVLFAAGTPSRVEARGCSDAKYDPAQCVFRTDVGEVQIRTTMQGDGWVVDQARVTAA